MWTITNNFDIFLYVGEKTDIFERGREYWYKASEGYSIAHPSNHPQPSQGWMRKPPEPKKGSIQNSVRVGYAGLGGALQGYTFDVLTSRWVTDYDFFLLAHGGSPAGGGNTGTSGSK